MPDKVPEENGIKKSDLVDLIKGTVAEAVKPMIDEVGKRVTDLEAAKPKIMQEPDLEDGKTTGVDPVDHAALKKTFKPRVEKDPRALPPEDEFSFIRLMNAQRNKDFKHAPYEEYALEESRKKAIAWASGSAGGYWVDSQFLPEEFIDNLVANIVCRQAGCQVLPCTGSPVNIPTKTAGATAYWVAQNAALTESSQTPGQVQLTPKWCTARTQISEFLAQTSAGAAEKIVRDDLARSIGLAVDSEMLVGTGTTYKPTGLINITSPSSPNSVAIGTNGGALTLAHMHSMLYEVELDNVPEAGLCWIMHPRTWNTIRQFIIATEANHYVINPTPTAAEPRSILGFPVYRTTQLSIALTKGSGIALGYVLLVNMKDVIMGEWGAIQLKATDVGGLAWEQNAIEIKATYTMDVVARHPDSICVLSDTSS